MNQNQYDTLMTESMKQALYVLMTEMEKEVLELSMEDSAHMEYESTKTSKYKI